MTNVSQPTVDRTPGPVDWLLLLGLGVLWGSGFYFIKKAVHSFDPSQVTFLRMAISTVVSLPIFFWFRQTIDWSRWKPLLIIAFCGYGIPNYLFALAEQDGRVSSGVAGVLNSTVPLLAMIIGVVFFRARTTSTKVVGVAVGFSGAVWLVVAGSGESAAQPWYAAACLMAALMYALNANIIGAYLRHFHPLTIGATAFLISGPIYLLGAWFSGALQRLWMPEHQAAVGAIVYLAVASTVIASAVSSCSGPVPFRTSIRLPAVSCCSRRGWRAAGAAAFVGSEPPRWLYLSRH